MKAPITGILYHIRTRFPQGNLSDLDAKQTKERSYRALSTEETRRLGRVVGVHAQPGDLIALRGDLGAGKTTFVQGMAEGLGVEELVTSPSFTLIHGHPGRVQLYHLDLYRLGPQDLPEIGIDDVIGAHAVLAVEWSERLPPGLSGEALEVELAFVAGEDQSRRIILRAHGPRGRRLLEAVAEELDAYARD